MIADLVRRPFLSLLWLLIRGGSRTWPDFGPGPILVVAPHPDDAALGCGGWMLEAGQRGRDIHILCLTDGAASHPGDPAWPEEQLRRVRRIEEQTAATHLGIPAERLHFFDWPDGRLEQLAQNEPGRVAELATFLESLRPSMVLVTARDEPSCEHRAACRMLYAAIEKSQLRPLVLEYAVWARWSPPSLWRAMRGCREWHYHYVGPEERRSRASAVAAHASQHAAPGLPGGFFQVFRRPEEVYFHYAKGFPS
ncbi:MAG: PIG-L family deacetylase [Candidatus Methylacidiphilales bacterium]|nr:PIG-L family deacetylase [Candidatus Methylacidiphilales bacterium]